MSRHVADVLAIAALSAIVTIAMALPVLRAPSDRIFGMDIVGRHHDPFTVMAQFARPVQVGAYTQPLTDIPGAMLERVAGPVAAYNGIVLVSFPLSAATGFMLARYLRLSRAGAAVAALVYAFSPFHVAQAAYHPHIAQTQWLPLYLLMLFRCLDRATPAAAGLLIVAAAAVTLSNFYAGMIAAVLTPVAVVAYWLPTRQSLPLPGRRLAVTASALMAVAAGGISYSWVVAPAVAHSTAVPRAELFTYSAKWWSYLVPPVNHPLLGGVIRRFWQGAGVREGLLEHQVTLGCGIVVLGLVALFYRLRRSPAATSVMFVPVTVAIAVTALVCSLSPDRTVWGMTFVRPSALLYEVAPMFRSYARFGVAVQLMTAVLAGLAVDHLLRAGTARARAAAVALLALAVAEYAVLPSRMWRDVLPTAAHRWVIGQPAPVLVLDCTEPTPESVSVRWLTTGRVALLGGAMPDCAEPNMAAKLAAGGYSHLLVRRQSALGWSLAGGPDPDGFRVAARFRDATVFAVTAPTPEIYTAGMTGFFPRERDTGRTWRWMGGSGSWIVVNRGATPLNARLRVELAAFHRTRRMEVHLDGRLVQTLTIEPSRRMHDVGPLAIAPGEHHLAFHPDASPTPAGDALAHYDRRPLSVALGDWSWQLVDQR